MNILFVIPSLGGGGQEKAGMMVCNYLQQFHNVSVVCLQEEQPNEAAYQCPIHRIPITMGKNTISKISVLLKRRSALKKLKRQLKPAVSIAFGETAILLNGFAGREKKIASMRQSLIKPTSSQPKYKGLYATFLKRSLRQADAVVAVCKELMQQLVKEYQLSNCSFIYNCIDKTGFENTEALSPAVAAFFNAPVIAHMGRFDASKCHWHLVNIFTQLKKEMPSVKLLLIGTSADNEPSGKAIHDYCLQRLEENNLKYSLLNTDLSTEKASAADVLFAGYVPDPAALLQRSTVFAFPSGWEGFPNAVLEAMACGLPVISAECPTGPKELISRAGILLPPFTAPFGSIVAEDAALYKQWIEIFKSLLIDPQTLTKYGNRSKERAENFSPDKILPQWKELVEKMV